jgi:hypothetical protein
VYQFWTAGDDQQLRYACVGFIASAILNWSHYIYVVVLALISSFFCTCNPPFFRLPPPSSAPAVCHKPSSPPSSASDIPLAFVSASSTDDLTQVCRSVVASISYCRLSHNVNAAVTCLNSTVFTPFVPVPTLSGHHPVLLPQQEQTITSSNHQLFQPWQMPGSTSRCIIPLTTGSEKSDVDSCLHYK